MIRAYTWKSSKTDHFGVDKEKYDIYVPFLVYPK